MSRYYDRRDITTVPLIRITATVRVRLVRPVTQIPFKRKHKGGICGKGVLYGQVVDAGESVKKRLNKYKADPI